MAAWDDGTPVEESLETSHRGWRQEIRALRAEVPLWSGLIVAVIVAVEVLTHFWR